MLYIIDHMNTKEIWKNIEGFDGDYQISNMGRVRSTKRNKITILSPAHVSTDRKTNDRVYTNHNSYLNIPLRPNRKKGNAKHFMVHRLVAKYFLPEPNDGQIFVNHKDGNRWNNRVDNIEWCTKEENERHKIYSLNHLSGSCIKPTPVLCVETGEKFTSQSSAARAKGVTQSSISSALYSGRKSAGYHWRRV